MFLGPGGTLNAGFGHSKSGESATYSFYKTSDSAVRFLNTLQTKSSCSASEENTLSNECTDIVISCPIPSLGCHHNCFIIITIVLVVL